MFGYSLKAWWLAIGAPVVGFVVASLVGLVVSLALVVCCAVGQRRWRQGARGRDLLDIHRFGGHR